jgi:ABC-type taurine transport system ATPase subunit
VPRIPPEPRSACSAQRRGQTTTLRLLLGFTRPSQGRVTLRGRSPLDPASRAGVAYLPERLALPARMTVRAFLGLHGTLAGLAGSALAREIDAVLGLTGLAGRAEDRLGGLSKGLAQRVGFAQALLGEPELLLLDEPTSGLDPLGVRDARDWILAARARGASVLVSSHVLSDIRAHLRSHRDPEPGRVAAPGAARRCCGQARAWRTPSCEACGMTPARAPVFAVLAREALADAMRRRLVLVIASPLLSLQAVESCILLRQRTLVRDGQRSSSGRRRHAARWR